MYQTAYLIGFVLVLNITGAGGAGAQAEVAEIVAAQLRAQGYTCKHPTGATKDASASRPNAAVWIITCENATYRATLIPNMAAKVEVLDNNAAPLD